MNTAQQQTIRKRSGSRPIEGLIKKITLQLFLACFVVAPVFGAEFSLVILGGRVIDPESGLDAIRNIGIKGDRITTVTRRRIVGDVTIDVAGLVVAPGFIDLHNHAFNPMSQEFQVLDGVTTALELESGSYPLERFPQRLPDGSIMNYGASAGYSGLRRSVMRDAPTPPERATEVGVYADQLLAEIGRRIEAELDKGALGIGLPLDYISKYVGAAEMENLFAVAGKRATTIFVHIRRGINGDPAGLYEVLKLAEKYGAGLHVCHITHSAMRNTDLFLKEIRAARERGVNVTTEILPFNAGSTSIGAAVFRRNWQEIFDITYEDVQWTETGEYLTKETFEQYQKDNSGGPVVHHYVREEWNRRAITEPGVMVVSDMLRMRGENFKLAPHHSAFSRSIGKYVRDEKLVGLPEMLAKMTYLPARRLEDIAPLFQRKGRLQEDADADLVVFDLKRISDPATYAEPLVPSTGVQFVIVNGEIVVGDGLLVSGKLPGRSLNR